MLLGREAECLRLDSLVAEARAGTSGTLVIRGEPGIGKTSLLAYAAEQAAGFRILRARGVESESALAFAGLNDLLRPVLDLVPAIPEPQAAALGGALALGPPAPGDRFATCAATFSLLAAAAEEKPLLALVDDAQWLDPSSAEAILFAARRLETEPTLVLFAVREGEPSLLDRTDLAELLVPGLEAAAGRELLGARVAPPVADRLVELTAGNPLALVEIPALLSDEQRSGAEPLDADLPAGPAIERAFRSRLDDLSDATRTALLVVASSDSGELETIERALASLGVGLHALDEAESARVVRVGEHVDLAHPLLRSEIRRAASGADRRTAHAALAGVEDPERRAWHLAAAAAPADESAAAAMEAVGLAARARGGYSEAGSAFERAAELTVDPHESAQRLCEAASDFRLAGRVDHARRLLDRALAADGESPATRARVEHIRGVVEMWHGSSRRAFHLLIEEAGRVEPSDPVRAARMLTDAAWAAFMSGEITIGRETAERACALSESSGGRTAVLAKAVLGVGLIVSGETSRALELVAPHQAELLRAVEVEAMPWGFSRPIGQVLVWLERYGEAREMLTRTLDTARARSALAALPFSLAGLSELDFRTGNWTAAYAGAAEAVRIAEDTMQASGIVYGLVCMAQVEAARGREDECTAHLARVVEMAEHQIGAAVGYAVAIKGFLELGLGRSEQATVDLGEVARRVEAQGLREPAVIQWAPNLIEAYVRVGRADEAERTLVQFEELARQTDRAWALACAARCRGLLVGDAEFELPFEEALAGHAGTSTPFERARTELCYGERLRRARRRADAREHLRAALETFERLGAEPWAERARREITASGETVRRRDPYAADSLTPAELQVALLVARGATNKEAGAALFLSPKTIETHLGRVYRKLHVRSRTELANVLGSQGAMLEPA
jgi:DNA-binding CsgD family transcriptional regulator/lipopolysaccharide biosynthesis regulator YciM